MFLVSEETIVAIIRRTVAEFIPLEAEAVC